MTDRQRRLLTRAAACLTGDYPLTGRRLAEWDRVVALLAETVGAGSHTFVAAGWEFQLTKGGELWVKRSGKG